MRKRWFTIITYLAILTSCNNNSPKHEPTPDPCYIFNSYYDTLNSFINDLIFYKEDYDPKYYNKEFNLQRHPDWTNYKDYNYFVRNHEKWSWLPHSLNYNRIQIRLNIESLTDTLRKYNCSVKKSLEFAYNAINKIKSDEQKEKLFEKKSIQQGEDFMLTGIKVSRSDVLYNENFEPHIECTIENNTELTLRSIQIYIKFCSDIKPGTHIKLTDDCYDLVNLKETFKPSNTYKFKINLDKKKTDRSTQRIEVKVLKAVKDNGELIYTYDVPFFE